MLRPMDIQNKEFSKRFKGYDCGEVDEFLDAVIKDYEQLFKENQSLKDRIGLMTETVEHYNVLESQLEKTVELSKQSAQDIRDNASMEAESIINKAKIDASRLSKQIDDEHVKKHQEMLNLKSEISSYKMRMRNICSGLMKMLDEIE